MQVTPVSHHSLRIHTPALYFAALSMPGGAIVLLAMVASVNLRGKVFRPGQARLAELRHCSRRTIIRQLRVLVERGYVRVIRRGRRLTNIYRLSRSLWQRLTGKVTPTRRPIEQGWLLQLDARMQARFAAMDGSELRSTG